MSRYIPVKAKFAFSLVIAAAWVSFSIWFSQPWIASLSEIIGAPLALFLIGFIAIVPGFMNAFVVSALLFDNRPHTKPIAQFPPVTLLIAAYNEEQSIQDTLQSISKQDYPAAIRTIVIDDGSSDQTVAKVREMQTLLPNLELICLEKNGGKANALNAGLARAETELVITVDADSWIRVNGVQHLIARYLSDPPTTRAVAGTILIRNSRKNWVTKAQEWDYFLGIAAIKRIQSLFQGTLVAQGAFSVYDRQTLLDVGGWPDTVGEDIVLTWSILAQGHRVGHSEDACVFTNAPDTLRGFVQQRRRWSRGLIEAFKHHPGLLFKARLSTLYVWWNTMFPFMDIAYTIGFIPGLVLAAFGHFWIVGPMTLALIPLSLLLNGTMFRKESKMFEDEHMVIRKNYVGFFTYIFIYGIILQPACVWGYLSEIFRTQKSWGTK